MITTLITATILARVLAGGPQAPVAHPCSEVGDSWEQLLSEAALPDNGWRRFLESIRTALVAACEVGRSESEPAPQAGSAPQAGQTGPGGVPQAGQAGSGAPPQADLAAPEGTPWTGRVAEPGIGQRTDRAGSGDVPQTDLNSGVSPQVDQAGSGFAAGDVRGDADLSATDDERTVGADGSSLSDLSELFEPPTRVRPPAVVSSARPRASQPSTPKASRTSPSPASTQRSQHPFDVKPAQRSQRPSDLESAKRSQGPSRLTPAKRSQPLDHGQIAAVAALRQIGTPYVWGGGSSAGPTGGGFDCSGLALHAWSKAGAALTHYTGSQFKQGRRVPFSQLRPGDLVFFGGGTGDPAHVGVYVKDGVMVHAPKRGDVVRTTNFAASAYYRLGYRGAVRPAPR
ncbi:Cell wall-associated hydrolase, NlpC family [Streptosporangium subroseum]|uniref:Cell wall-associated hydrolase, NlpC family n=1 Tax=Streptosporangium subroseum TaxID=106412 RepID=A0A239M891_9ACTN|nr:C40 family peptidase [Streptosporangium subroseum]SNT38650.1 Cell wall-associated hydrolase, NlpC family [Streptosporangium subroseum]